MPFRNPAAHDAFRLGQLAAAVDTHDHLAVRGDHAAHLFTHGPQLGQHIRQVILALGVIIAQGPQHFKQQRRFHTIVPGIDLFDLLLLFGSIFLFHNAGHVPVSIPQDPSVTEGVIHQGGHNRSRRAGFNMLRIELFQFIRLQQRRVPAQDHHRAGKIFQGIRSLQHRMTGPQLFRLQGDPGPVSHQFPHQFRAVADHHHVITAAGRFRRVHHMLQHGMPAHFVQHFR